MRTSHWVWGLALWAACAARQPEVTLPRDYPGYLASSETLGRPFMVQQVLKGRYGERELAMDVVVQLAADKLTLVGLTPFGSRAFVLEQSGQSMRFQQYVQRELPVDPAFVLNDVHRVFFRGLAGPLPDGLHVAEDHGERVTEQWRGGSLVERRFERLEGKPRGSIVVRFQGAPAPVIAPEVLLENQWFGYSLSISSATQTWLDTP